MDWAHNEESWQQYNEKKLWAGPLKVVETEEDQRTHGRGQLRRSWEAWNWAGAKRRARHKIGRSGGVSSAACVPAGVERQRRRSCHKCPTYRTGCCIPHKSVSLFLEVFQVSSDAVQFRHVLSASSGQFPDFRLQALSLFLYRSKTTFPQLEFARTSNTKHQ